MDTSQRNRDPAAADVRSQLDRVLTSAEFAQSDRLRRFLCHVVEETLGGRGAALKEYTIALDVFDRDESFNPQISSIVRVEASRLRTKLDKYNATEGRDDPVRIALPPGSYVPTFEAAGSAAKQPDAAPAGVPQVRHAKWRIALLATVVVGLGLAAVLYIDPARLRTETGRQPESIEPAPANSIAVLPFRNLSPDPAETYLSDGITESLISGLAMGGLLRVISMTSAMAYKNVDRRVAEIARELGVSHVVEGSVQRAADKVRITVQLIEASTDHHLWAESYERDVDNILAIQSDVVRRVVASLKDTLGVDSVPAATTAKAVNQEALEAYLRGRYFRNQMTEAGFRKGIDYFEQAIAKAPDYADAYAGMASCYCLLGGHGFELVEPRKGMPAAKQAALEALRLDGTLPEAHAFLGIIRLKYEWDWAGAEAAFQQAIRLNPSYAQARIFYSYFLEAMGRQEEAIRQAEAAKALDPLSLAANVNLGWQLLRADRLDEALRQLEKTGELQPDFWGVHWGLGHYHRKRGEYDLAIEAFRAADEVGGGYTLPMTDLGYTYAIAGRRAEARDILDRLESMARDNYVSPYNMAVVHAGLGEIDEAFAWLEKAFQARSRSLAWLKVSTEIDALRSDPRFNSLMHRVGLSN